MIAHIYFARSERTGLMKIGSTNNLRRRLKQLDIYFNDRLSIVDVIRLKYNRIGILGAERFVHKLFRSRRAGRTEWFRNIDFNDIGEARVAFRRDRQKWDAWMRRYDAWEKKKYGNYVGTRRETRVDTLTNGNGRKGTAA